MSCSIWTKNGIDEVVAAAAATAEKAAVTCGWEGGVGLRGDVSGRYDPGGGSDSADIGGGGGVGTTGNDADEDKTMSDVLLIVVAFALVCVFSTWVSLVGSTLDVITGEDVDVDVDDDEEGDDVSKDGDEDRNVRDPPIASTSTPAPKEGGWSPLGVSVWVICVVIIVMVGTTVETAVGVVVTAAADDDSLFDGIELFDGGCWVCGGGCDCG